MAEATAWVAANDDKCSFCKGEFPGYALKDKDGTFKPACWDCAKERANGGSKSVATAA